MKRFECDYTEGAHPKILDALVRTNSVQTPGYGTDKYCESARKMIRAACGNEDMDVQFLSGGTQANATLIAAALRPHQAALAAATAHIAEHETGAIEATGHKVLTLPTPDGKITAQQVKQAVESHWADPTREHTPQPGLVYVSQPTETGMIYSKHELQELYKVCKQNGLYFFIDGARLGYALAAPGNDAFLADISKTCDMFYIGGTKVGAMFGEAVCIIDETLKRDFRYHIKQRGGMLAKGRFLGLQFETLFRDGLYLEISKNAVTQALKIKRAFQSAGCDLRYNSPTNQQFPIVNTLVYNELTKKYSVNFQEQLEGDRIVIRVCTSWATKPEDADALIEDVTRICNLYKTEAGKAAQEYFS
ncbi:MAG: aminotransferase class V-fold PLP-dependent enzyme [Oscillospiraceae bacterium]|jgi:threonine aldolase|nr:aminotransferase class V-fold PLP-dependent enzyme [Oscillospiraceae bacterium]